MGVLHYKCKVGTSWGGANEAHVCCSLKNGGLEHGRMRVGFTGLWAVEGSVESEELGPSVFSLFASWFFSAIYTRRDAAVSSPG